MLDWKSFPDTGILENVLFLAIISPYQKECHVLTYVQYQIRTCKLNLVIFPAIYTDPFIPPLSWLQNTRLSSLITSK